MVHDRKPDSQQSRKVVPLRIGFVAATPFNHWQMPSRLGRKTAAIAAGMRVARVVEAEQVEEARKLLKLTLSLGGDERRTVFAGIKQAYDPETLVGRLVVMVANLAPRKMKFGLSEGMVVASGPGGKEVFLLSPDDGAQPGQRVH